MPELRRSFVRHPYLALTALLLLPTSAFAYPDTKEECDDAGGKWVERDLEGGGCASFCYLRLEADPASLSPGGGGGPSAGPGNAALRAAGDGVLAGSRRRLQRIAPEGLAGDVAVSLRGADFVAFGAATCPADPEDLLDGAHVVGVLHLRTRLRFQDAAGEVRVGGDYRLELSSEPGALPEARLLDLQGRLVVSGSASLGIDPAIAPEVSGGDPRACWAPGRLVLDLAWEGLRLRVEFETREA